MIGYPGFPVIGQVTQIVHVPFIKLITLHRTCLHLAGDKYGLLIHRNTIADNQPVGISEIGCGMPGMRINYNGIIRNVKFLHQVFFHLDVFAISVAKRITIPPAHNDERRPAF